MPAPWITNIAESIPYDNSDSGLVSENVQDAIDELKDEIDCRDIPAFIQEIAFGEF